MMNMKITDTDSGYIIAEAICKTCWDTYNVLLSKIFSQYDAARCGGHSCKFCGMNTNHVGRQLLPKKDKDEKKNMNNLNEK